VPFPFPAGDGSRCFHQKPRERKSYLRAASQFRECLVAGSMTLRAKVCHFAEIRRKTYLCCRMFIYPHTFVTTSVHGL
jgi:hypothetical protein